MYILGLRNKGSIAHTSQSPPWFMSLPKMFLLPAYHRYKRYFIWLFFLMMNLIEEIESRITRYPKSYSEFNSSKQIVSEDIVIFAKLHDIVTGTWWRLSEYDLVNKTAFGCIDRNWNLSWELISITELSELKVWGLNRVCIIHSFTPQKLKDLEINLF